MLLRTGQNRDILAAAVDETFRDSARRSPVVDPDRGDVRQRHGSCDGRRWHAEVQNVGMLSQDLGVGWQKKQRLYAAPHHISGDVGGAFR